MVTSATRPTPARRRAAILSAAATLFRERGFNGVGIDGIGAAVGVSGPALYRYFAGKRELLAGVVEEFLAGLTEAAVQGGDEHRMIRDSVGYALGDRDSLAVCLRQLEHLAPDARRGIDDHLARLHELWRNAVRDGDDAGRLALRVRAAGGAVISASFTKGPLRSRATEFATDMVYRLALTELPPVTDGRPATAPQAGRRLPRASRREAILSVAAALFREHGFNGVSLADIGAEVGITASAVNRHFRSKERLLAAAFNRAGEQIAAGITTALTGSGTPEAAVAGIVTTYAALAIDSRDLIMVNMSEMHYLPAAERRQRRRNQRMYVDELVHALLRVSPAIGEAEATFRARAAFALINEVIGADRLIRRPGIRTELAALAMAVLQPDHVAET